MLIVLQTDKTVSEAAAALEMAVFSKQFGIVQSHNLTRARAGKGVEIAGECRILEVCPAAHARMALRSEMTAVAALPCRIAIYAEGGRTTLSTLRPTVLMAMTGIPGLISLAHEIEASILHILNEVATA